MNDRKTERSKHAGLIAIVMLIAGLPSFSHGQGFVHTDGQAVVDGAGDTLILKGMGLGGWMLQEGYMLQTAGFASAQYQIRDAIEQLIGPANTDTFYQAWLANHVTKADIDSLKSWGFNSVRLPMHYNLFTLPIEDEPIPGENTWLTKGFELTDSLISWCRQNEMYVVLDLHAAPGGQGYDQAISDYDPTKPSLFESTENQNKAAALWKRLADRYVNEPWIAGYDLLNEPNWNLPGGTLLRQIYEQMTDSIRSVDTNHMLIIEGNWFANDFTGLTPPWDNNMLYSPHKYWSYNDQASIQWVLDLRETHNVPLYLGETGENSNTWFRDAAKLFADFDIGWAWWPMKKVEAIAGPLSVVKNPGYQDLLDYWNNGGTPPDPAVAKASLMALTENLKIEHCVYQKDVIDALFRQVEDSTAIPFRSQNIPGVVYASDFDMGIAGVAYQDVDLATYQVSTGVFTAWNQGWSYRNDGVDIETIDDSVNSNGYGVGWLGEGEWMQYDVNLDSSAVYEVHMRIAAGDENGRFHLGTESAQITPVTSVASTGGWSNWQTIVLDDVLLETTDRKLRFYMDQDGFNLSSLEFVPVAAASSVPADYVYALTLDESKVRLYVNKSLSGPLPGSPADFQIVVNGSPVTINAVMLDADETKVLEFEVAHTFIHSDIIEISYSGSQIQANDGTLLTTFSLEEVENTVPQIHPVPGRVEAEAYFFQQGVQLENTTDVGGGQNIAFLDPGDYLDYYVNVAEAGFYHVSYRTAAETEVGEIQLQLVDSNGVASTLHTVEFQPTGGWQTWTTTSQSLALPEGKLQLRLLIREALFNMNWFKFNAPTSIRDGIGFPSISIYPNPSQGQVEVRGDLEGVHDIHIKVLNRLGQEVKAIRIPSTSTLDTSLDLSSLPDGAYFLMIASDQGIHECEQIVKTGG